MRAALQIISAIVVMITLAIWLATGAHVGWTQTRVTVMKVDPITELEYPETEDKFVAGVEVLGAGFGAAFALFAGSFLFKKQPTRTNKTNQ